MAIASNLKSMDMAMFARASEGLTHWRGIAVTFASLLVAGALLALGMYFAASSASAMGAIMLFICWVLYALVGGAGISASGIMLLDQARGAPERSMMDAFVYGFMCVIKSWGVALVMLAAAILFVLAAALVYLISKIPGVGPLLLFFAHPVLVVAAGFLIFVAGFVFFPLVMPALWDGDGVLKAIAKTVAILRERFMVAVLYLILMAVVTAFILGIMAWVIVPGYLTMTGLAAGVIGTNLAGDMSSMLHMMNGGSGHLTAAMLATAVLFMVGIVMALQVYLMGINLVYLGVSEGVDVAAAEQMLKQQIDQAKAKAEEARQRAVEAAERAKQAAQQSREAAPQAAPAQAAANICPKCNAAVNPDDVFCESCGNKLK